MLPKKLNIEYQSFKLQIGCLKQTTKVPGYGGFVVAYEPRALARARRHSLPFCAARGPCGDGPTDAAREESSVSQQATPSSNTTTWASHQNFDSHKT